MVHSLIHLYLMYVRTDICCVLCFMGVRTWGGEITYGAVGGGERAEAGGLWRCGVVENSGL